jgi:hypothetical protein
MQAPGANCYMMCAKMVFALVVSKIFFPWVVFDVKLPCFHCIHNPENLISIDLDCWCLTVLFAMPTAVELLQLTGIGGSKWLISSKYCCLLL